jgi:alpha-L-arabinofuranosidase
LELIINFLIIKLITMKKYIRLLSILFIAVLFSSFIISAQKPSEISVQANNPVADIQPTMWGIFFEDINFAADGGLYAELVKNRSFEFSLPMIGWKQVRQNGDGRVMASFYSPADPNNPRFLTVVVDAVSGTYGLSNEGFRGMGIKKDMQYNFSVSARVAPNSYLKMKIELVNAKGDAIGSTDLPGLSTEWKNLKISFKATQTEPKATLRILFTGKGTIDLDMVSLFPSDTWKERPNGMRKDLVQLLADLKPGFIRFPGGCIVEGRDLTNRYQWKTTVGPVEERKLIMNRWNVEMQNHLTPDYFQTFGLGFFEYFQLAEDIGAEPLPILNCGMSCQFNAAEVVPLNELDPYIQDALDLIEFANGEVTTKWGRLRATMGHPASFNLKFLGVGNEQWEEQYIERYILFEKVLKSTHPEIKIVSGSGPSSDGKYFDYAWSELKKLSPDLIDEHYYKPPEWFFNNTTRYDNYDRKGIKIFAGEYAAHGKESSESESRNTWYSALAEAAFMTGLERNAAVVNMASYAPLFAHVEAWQWRPDLIWFDNLTSIGTPNYYVQKIFSNYKGTQVIPVLCDGKNLVGQDSLYSSGTIDKNADKVYIKLINISAKSKSVNLNLQGLSFGKECVMETLKSKGLFDYNTIANPKLIYPVLKELALTGKKINIALDPVSVNVIILNYRK